MTKEMAITILRGDVLGTDEQTHEAVFMAIKALKEQERVDAVEVVRCKDCRYYDAESHNCLDELGYARVWEEDDYCSFAERKNDATND